MTQKEIDSVSQAAIAYNQAISSISSWCDQVSIGMGFHGCNDIKIYPTRFSFIAFWYSPYQTETREAFGFDWSDLALEPKNMVAKLQQQQEKLAKSVAEEQEQLRAQEKADLAQYELLRKRFG